ncbi:MAG: DUF1232 domain-containing protein [Paludibacteraceae bacterium]|nr:DUF1232 domain-containing protein [Paludibacteraceae bacterium]
MFQFDPKSVDITMYEGYFAENTFLAKLKGDSKKLGDKIVYDALKLYYCHKSQNTPATEKSTIAGALGYLVSPYDAIPDSMPLYGTADDAAILSYALKSVSLYVGNEVEVMAKSKLGEWFDKTSIK